MSTENSRRAFLRVAASSALAMPFISRFGRALALENSFDPDFGTATQAVQAIRSGVISSLELTMPMVSAVV